ncbi:MAG: uroporphyrinogen decarboxylase family protein [Candidatus Limnocylindrales bacterium]
MDLAYLTAQAEAGAQALQVFDSWVGQLSPVRLPFAPSCPTCGGLFQGLEALGLPTIHFGTGAAGLLALMAEAGGDVIGLDWRIALSEGWAKVPSRAVQGNLDPQAVLGSWTETERQARWVLDEAGGRPGHIFNLGHGVLPPTDPDQLRRLVDLVHETTERSVEPALKGSVG